MAIDSFVEWLRRQGHRVIRTVSTYWYDASPHIYQAFPYHWLIQPSRNEVDTLFKQGAIALRYSSPLMASIGQLSYHVVCTEKNYDLGNLPKKVRHDVKRGISSASVEPISFSRLATDGWQLRYETLERQRRMGAESQEWWEKLCYSTEGLPGFETWAAIIKGQLAASLIAFTYDDCCSILYQQSRTQFLPFGVNNALAFVFTNEVMSRPEKPWLFYGLHSLDASPSVDEFKFRMGYTAKPVRQRVVFHPWLAPLFNPASHATLRGLLHLMPGNPTLAKTEGMVRFYLEGRKPLEKQTWPSPLLQNKDALEER